MSNLLRKPKSEYSKEIKGKYEFLNLRENPFPNTPFVNKNNEDIRYNGSIYEGRIREKEHEQILNNFIRVPQNDPNHIRLGYILDYSYVGRGNGKSAFALNLIDEINKEFCLDISDEQNKCFGLHITPEVSGRTKTFYSFTDLIFDTIIERGLINYSLASLRLEAINTLYPKVQTDNFKNEQELVEKLNDINWYRENNIEIASITKHFYQNSELTKISPGFPLERDKTGYYLSFVTNEDHFRKHYYENLKGKQRIEFFYNDLVLLFVASGFNGSYLIVDDFERIPDFQSKKLKQEFALELRTNFFDGILENAKIGFYNLILVLHAGVPRLIEESWAVSGMNRRSPMNDDNSRHTVKFDRLTVDHAILMLEKYLEKYRLNDRTKGLHPFTEDAVKIISEKAELNASTIIEKAYTLIERATEVKQEIINEEFVNSELGQIEEESTDLGEDISKEASEDLFRKSKSKE